MTTDGNIIEYVRDINLLLEMDSYQDMTDAEIQSVIDYYIERAKIDGKEELRRDAQYLADYNLMIERQRQAELGSSVLQSMLEVQIPWVTVGGDS